MTARSRSLSVLVVDDAEGVRESLSATLAAAGHSVATASSGDEALQRLRDRSFDVLLTDLWMAGIDGVGLLKRTQREYPAMRLIAMTGGGPAGSIEVAATLAQTWGADPVFLKPFDERELLALLETHAAEV